ncbi:acetolactate synthase small subunit [Sandaracinus amylolyticus]|uniref:Acetolactate synthase small subunit n=1 Tax=Sandaracinus amylolyticus TaxID=927083 RepID=A0A0F6W5K8_9BACT|nr:acetolactate synthase small subunit [Sandaracinus amylolyticus]AKF08062.1 Acetolactate synthase small subunit [Sandaracinus amylolyticus]
MSDRVSLRTFVVLVEDVPGVLNRVASLFRRRNFNIESLSVGRTHEPGISRMTIVVRGDDRMGRLVEANLYKLVDVVRVDDITHRPSVTRDIALVRVRATPADRAAILQVCSVFRARVVDVALDSMMIECTGTEDKIRGLVTLLEPFGVLEMVQAGSIAMTRGASAQSASASGEARPETEVVASEDDDDVDLTDEAA